MVQFVEQKFYKLDLNFLQTGFYELVFYKLVPYRSSSESRTPNFEKRHSEMSPGT